jgi:dihydroorotase
VFYKTLQYLQQFDGVLIDHPQDPWLSKFGQMHEGISSTQLGMKGIPRLAEEIILQRNIELLAFAGGRLHVNKLSSGRSAELIKQAKKKLNISADVASYQLLLTDELLSDFDTNYKVSPPLREASDIESLKKALREKTIEVICSGHHALDEECKNLEFDMADAGIIALQTVGANLSTLSEDIDWPTLLAAVTTGPRKAFKVDVPSIEPEQKANLTLFDPEKKWILNERSSFSKSKNSPWWNKELTGKAVAVWNNNKSWFDKDEY